jgi:hypothetical protein
MVVQFRRILSQVIAVLSSEIRLVGERWLLSSAPRAAVRTFELRNYGVRHETEVLFAKMAAAIDLVAEVDPRRFSRMRSDIKYIIATPLQKANAAYLPKSRTCYLNSSVVKNHSAANLAILLVHEATHARLELAGVRQWPDRRMRFERVCVRAEIAFADRLPRATFPTIESWIAKRMATSLALQAQPLR